MLVYTKTKLILSTLLLFSLITNAVLVWFFIVDVPPAERKGNDFLFPGIELDSGAPTDLSQLLRHSFVFVEPVSANAYHLVTADRQDCSFVFTMNLSADQSVDPALYAGQPILVEEFSERLGEITLLKISEDTFAAAHLSELKKVCPDFARALTAGYD